MHGSKFDRPKDATDMGVSQSWGGVPFECPHEKDHDKLDL